MEVEIDASWAATASPRRGSLFDASRCRDFSFGECLGDCRLRGLQQILLTGSASASASASALASPSTQVPLPGRGLGPSGWLHESRVTASAMPLAVGAFTRCDASSTSYAAAAPTCRRDARQLAVQCLGCSRSWGGPSPSMKVASASTWAL